MKTRLLATLMAVILIFCVSPLEVFADSEQDGEDTDSIDSSDESEDVFVVAEDETKRGEFEKHYLCSDGTFMAVTYPEAIHYLDKNGKWRDINQTLTYDSVSGQYTTEESDFQVSFSTTDETGSLISINHNENQISWGLQTTAPVTVVEYSQVYSNRAPAAFSNRLFAPTTEKVFDQASLSSSAQKITVAAPETSNEEHPTITDESAFDLPNTIGSVHYTNIFGSKNKVSVRYGVYHNRIEEDIYFEEKSDLSSISMGMEIGNLIPSVKEDGSVDLLDSQGNIQYTIGSPYLVDAAFEVCRNIEVTASKEGTFCTVTYTPDEAWFTSNERVYPILLDPSVTSADYQSNLKDTYVEENSTVQHQNEEYLYYDKNGTNKRRMVVSISSLPVIEHSLPITGAYLLLTAQGTNNSCHFLKAVYQNTAFEIQDYDYDAASVVWDIAGVTASCYTSGNVFTFNFTSGIYKMYEDEKSDQERGEAYHGDIIIGYLTENESTAANPCYSTEFWMGPLSNKPVFQVKYGYSLPSELLDGKICSFQNGWSFSNMTLTSPNPSNSSNVFQVYQEDSATSDKQKFQLEYQPERGSYHIYAIGTSSTSKKAIGAVKSTNGIVNGNNVMVYTASSNVVLDWIIVPYDRDTFRIVPLGNMSLCLSVSGTDDGSSTGKTSTSPGNIFVQTIDDTNDYQCWTIYDEDAHAALDTEKPRAKIETGDYYIFNDATETALYRSGTAVSCKQGLISDLGEIAMKWHIVNLGDGFCTIQRSDCPNYYLYEKSNANGGGIGVKYNTAEEIPNDCKWAISFARVTGYKFIIESYSTQTTTTFYSLSSNLQTGADTHSVCINFSASKDAPDYNKQVWQIFRADGYTQLGLGTSFDGIDVDIGETKEPAIHNNQSSANFRYYTDFDYHIDSGNEFVSYDATTKKFTGVASGTVRITAIHRPTGITRTFDVRVNKNAIVIIPGFLGSELTLTEDYGNLRAGEKVWPPFDINHLENFNASNVLERLSAMSYNLDGTPVCENIEALNLNGENESEETTTHFGTLDLYGELKSNVSFNNYSVALFQYDWRNSNAVSARKLDDWILQRGYDKVILIAHSMGGLVAANYLKLGTVQQDKVNKLILLGSPLLGSPIVAMFYEMSDILEDLINNVPESPIIPFIMDRFLLPVEKRNDVNFICSYLQSVLGIMHNMPSVYEVLPCRAYVEEHHYLGSGLNMPIITYDESVNKLSSKLHGFNMSMMQQSETLNQSLFIGNDFITSTVDSYYIVGCNVSTIESVNMDVALLNIFNFSPIGDNTVPSWSADLGGRYPAKTFYVLNCQHITIFGDKSNDLINADTVIEKIGDVINGIPNKSVTGITKTPPIYAVNS